MCATSLHVTRALSQAKEALKEAERCDPDNIFTQFSLYKLAIQEKNIEKGNHKKKLVLKKSARGPTKLHLTCLFMGVCALQRQPGKL